jgi:hypothetical protein
MQDALNTKKLTVNHVKSEHVSTSAETTPEHSKARSKSPKLNSPNADSLFPLLVHTVIRSQVPTLVSNIR